MLKMCTLRELTESMLSSSYFGTFADRLSVANAFIAACNEPLYDKNYNCVIAEFSPDTVSVCFDTELNSPVYSIGFSSPMPRKALKATRYDNLDNAPLSVVQFCDKKRKRANLREISHRYVNENKAYTVTVMLFYILFGCHPFKGASYYSESVDREYDLNYFSVPHGFIFDPACYNEEKIEGYHDCPYLLWERLSDEQRLFFTSGLLNASPRYLTELLTDWSDCFKFRPVTLKAICGQNVKACFFDKDYALIATDTAVWRNAAKCVNCNKTVREKCKGCDISSKAFVTVTVLDVSVCVSDAALGKTATEFTESTLSLITGERITGKDLDPENGGDEAVFEVIPTKKIGVVGFKYLAQAPICVESEDGTDKPVSQDNPRFVLNVGDKIYVTDSVTLQITGCTTTMQNSANNNDND